MNHPVISAELNDLHRRDMLQRAERRRAKSRRQSTRAPRRDAA